MMYSTVHYSIVQLKHFSYGKIINRLCRFLILKIADGPGEHTKDIYIYNMHVTCLYVLVVNYFMFLVGCGWRVDGMGTAPPAPMTPSISSGTLRTVLEFLNSLWGRGRN